MASRYVIAGVATAVAFVARMALSKYLGPPYILFYPTVMLVAMLGGLGPGVVATALSALFAAYWILPSVREPMPVTTRDAVGLAVFTSIGVFMSVVAHIYRQGRQRIAQYEKAVALRQADNRLRASEDKLRLAQDAAKMGSWDWNLLSGEIAWSERCKAIFGLPLDTVITYDLFLAAIHPEDRDRIDFAVKDALASQRDYDVEMRVPLGDGTVRWVASKGRGFYDAGGRAVRMAGMALDVTVAKRAEEALRAGESKYRTLYENTPGMMHSIDRHGHIVSVSDWWLEVLGYNRAEVIGRKSVEFLTPESRKYALEVVLPEYFRTGVCRDVPYQFVKKNGDVIDVLLSATAERDAGGEFVRSLAVLIDVTQRKRAEEALREADRRKNEFLGMLSHELRNPLAPMRNAVYILDRAEPGGEQAARAKAVIGRQVEHLARLVDDLLDVTRISRGKIQLQRRRLDLGKLVLRTIEDYKPLFADREIALDVRIAAGPLWVDADETRIAQVVGNVLLNSEKFTDAGGCVTVSVERDGPSAAISIQDTGAGIAPDMLDRLFEPFVQVDNSLHRAQGGLGLGLALVKGLVDLHRGTVEARSAGVGCGAEFVVRLPLASAEAEAPRPPPIASARVFRHRRVLIIEDNPDAAETLREMLEIGGHEAEIAHDGREGVEKARAFRPEIVLCDIGLPEMDGYAVARAIRSEPTLASTMLVALTGYAMPDDQRRAAEAGFDWHLAKPVSVAQIEEVLSTAARVGRTG